MNPQQQLIDNAHVPAQAHMAAVRCACRCACKDLCCYQQQLVLSATPGGSGLQLHWDWILGAFHYM